MLFCQISNAQEVFLIKKADNIDTLAHYNNFIEAEKQANDLYDLLLNVYTEKIYYDLKLRVMLQKAYLYNRSRKNGKTIEITLDIIDQAKKYNLPDKEYKAYLVAAEMYEITGYDILCKDFLDKAHQLYNKNNLQNIYSIYCIRNASYHRLFGKKDSALYFAYQGLDFAQKYQNQREELDAYLLLGILLDKNNSIASIKYFTLAAKGFLKKNDYLVATLMHNNIGWAYLKRKEYDKAFAYSDTAFLEIQKCSTDVHISGLYQLKSALFDSLQYIDSAYFYYKKYHTAVVDFSKKQETVEIKNITEKYENDKKEAALQIKNQQIIYIIVLLSVILMAAVFLIRKNRKINAQNKIISKQVEELIKTLEQKQVLLSELQHRVKNNLQHVISILEIQKESVDFNNIDELIRGNQNRIHSMALLHKKLNISENANEVDFEKYITDVSELVKNSYEQHSKKISLDVSGNIDKMSIAKALPLGLIVVELVSNSMKHAFKKQTSGHIAIHFDKNANTQLYNLDYIDNGTGFDFNKINEKGLGVEIIKGLIGQLDATVENLQYEGFHLRLQFK